MYEHLVFPASYWMGVTNGIYEAVLYVSVWMYVIEEVL
jgi:hypothetical protein